MAKRKRKKPDLKADRKRQAHNSLRGYRYQILHSVAAWLDLADTETLYLEGVEDFDKVSDDTFTAVQVKDARRKITLRSQEVNDAINNYWRLQTNDRDRSVKFRFLTRSEIGLERGNPFGTGKPGLQVWRRCSGDEESIAKISGVLQEEGKISEDVKDFLKQAKPQEIYEQLIAPISWETGSKPVSFVEQSICEKLVLHGYQLHFRPAESKKVFDSLINEAWKVATHKDNRVLTKVHFLEIFEEQTTQRVSNEHMRYREMQTTILGNVSTPFISSSSNISIQSHSPILNTIPPLFPDVTPRTDLITRIQTKLQSEGMVVIHGGTGRGKTTLTKLTAKDASDSWLWLSFTNKDSSEIVKYLQQLAIQISDQSSPINIVLDDLNLQPQELREYEETLGIVVYRVLERGAKLLITSQHKPPNSFIRQLDASSSIVVHVPDFTLAEIEQFAEQLKCPAEDAKNWAQLIQLHTSGHPRLVHARLARLREENWIQQNVIESLVQTPGEVVEEREEARRLLADLPDNQQEFLYRLSLMATEFRKDYAVNIGEIPESLPYVGDIFGQLVGPWIDPVNKSYYTISPLLTRAADHVWSESKRNMLHAQIADAILKTGNLTRIEACAVLTHSIVGKNKLGFIAVLNALRTAPEENWKEICQEFSWLIHVKPDIPEQSFPRDTFIKHLFRSLQYRIAAEVEPESAPKILEIWDKETKPYEPHQSYLLARLEVATEALMYCQASLSAKQIVGFLREIFDITDNNNEVQKIYYSHYIAQFEEQKGIESNYFSFLFSIIYRAPRPIDPPFFSELIDALDSLPTKIRTLLLVDFKDESIDSRLLIDGVWWAEANRENPDWGRCLKVFDKAIEKAVVWGYPHLAAASARGKGIIHDEYLHNSDAAHEALQDFIAKVGVFPSIEEEQAFVYLHQKLYKDALNIYDRILSTWNPPSEQVNLGPLEVYRRAAICAAELNDWEKAATFFEEGAIRTERIENSERYISLYADAGFAQFKAGNMLECIKLLNSALEGFEKLVQDKGDGKYITLKKCLVGTIECIAKYSGEKKPSEPLRLPPGLCSDPAPNETILSLPDAAIGYAWSHLAQVEYRFGRGSTALEHALRISDRDANPKLNFSLSLLEAQHDFRNKTFDNLPQRIHQLANTYNSIQKQTGQGIGAAAINSSFIAALDNLATVENIVFVLGTALLVRLRTSREMHDMLVIWRSNSSELPIEENLIVALDLIESTLSGDLNNALAVMNTQDAKYENRLAAALKVVNNTQTSPDDLFYAHTFIATSLIGNTLDDSVLDDFAELFSAQWLEKTKLPATLQIPRITVPQIEQACKGSETGKKKIGQILLAVHQAVSVNVAPEIQQQFRSWTEFMPDQGPEPKTGQNPIAKRIIKVMENPPHLTHEDVEALRRSIEEGKMPVKFDSPFEPDEPEKP